MKRTLFSLIIAASFLMLTAVNCHEIDPPEPQERTFTFGGYFLNAGITGHSELTQLNTLLSIVTPRCFSMVNDGKALGDGACDIRVFGNKMYVSLASSKRVAVIGKNNCKELGSFTISTSDGTLLTPGYMADFEGKLLVGLAEGYVASIDTTSFSVQQLQPIGDKAGNLAIANQKLYVANPNGQTIQMMNPVDLHVMKTVDVGLEPRSFTVGSDNKLYLIADSELSSSKQPRLLQVDSDTETVTSIPTEGQPQLVAASPDKSLVVYVRNHADELGGRFYVVNLNDLKIEGDFVRDGSYVKDPTGLFIDTNTGNVYISQDGEGGGDFGLIYIYTSYGQYLSSFNTGTARTVGAAFVTGKQ